MSAESYVGQDFGDSVEPLSSRLRQAYGAASSSSISCERSDGVLEFWVPRVSPNCTPRARGWECFEDTPLFDSRPRVKTWLRSLTCRGGYMQFFPTEDLISPEMLQHLFY